MLGLLDLVRVVEQLVDPAERIAVHLVTARRLRQVEREMI
jgi:hypothetical protein